MKTLALVLAAVLCAWTAHAVPPTMSYQGVLRDASGNVVPDGPYALTFSIYEVDAGGTAIWSEAQAVSVEGGIVNAVLGIITPLELPFDVAYWLGISIEGETELPRTMLTSVPYAQRAVFAEEVDDGDWMFNEGDIFRGEGNVGIGTAEPSEKLDVEGTAKVTGFQLTTAPARGHVLMSDAGGVGSWQPASGGVGGGGTDGYVTVFTDAAVIGNSNIYETEGRYSIGTTTSDARLRVDIAGNLPALKLVSTSEQGITPVLHVERSATLPDEPMVRMKSPPMAGNYHQLEYVLATASGDSTVFFIDGWGGVHSTRGIACVTDDHSGVRGTTSSTSATAAGVQGEHTAVDFDGMGVYGRADVRDGYGRGGVFQGGSKGVDALAFSAASGGYIYGVDATGMGGDNSYVYGVNGYAYGGTGAVTYGIYGGAGGGTTNWAGWFDGDVNVTGTVYGPASALVLDHPLDPGGQYLRQPAVHSSEMKNVYDGTVMLDSSGEAWVELPDWLEALNTDFRYQLTAIGAPGPDLHVADEVAGNRFSIAGGDPGMKVSWMLTGVRHDAHAKANAVLVEEQKRADERGKYLQPEAHGAPPDVAIGRRADAR